MTKKTALKSFNRVLQISQIFEEKNSDITFSQTYNVRLPIKQ